jgi:hypothetical protein
MPQYLLQLSYTADSLKAQMKNPKTVSLWWENSCGSPWALRSSAAAIHSGSTISR